MGLIIAKSAGCCCDFSNISLSTIICIEVKKCVKVLYLIKFEGRIACNYWFSEDNFPLRIDYSLTLNTHLDILTLI